MAEKQAQAAPGQRLVWAASGLRRVTLAFIFLLLLPFYASIGPMLFTRLRHGLLADAFWLSLIGLAFTAIMALVLIQLVHAIRNKVVIDDEKISFTLPSVAGNIQGLAFFSKTLPLKDIRAVETREEIYGSALAPVRLVSTRLVTREGEPVVLGFMNPHNTDQTFPMTKIGGIVAERVGVKVTEHGAVRRSATGRLLGHTGSAAGKDAVTPQELEAINQRHKLAMRAVIAGFVMLFAGGIAVDVLKTSSTTYAPLLSDEVKDQPKSPQKK
ncbi:MAG: hypothetical protein RL291_358 [Pseudomonadota bacterium]|jgi:hypothetical protein